MVPAFYFHVLVELRTDRPFVEHLVGMDVSSHATGQELHVLLHQHPSMLISPHVIEESVGQEVVFHQVQEHPRAADILQADELEAVFLSDGLVVERVVGMSDALRLQAHGHLSVILEEHGNGRFLVFTEEPQVWFWDSQFFLKPFPIVVEVFEKK